MRYRIFIWSAIAAAILIGIPGTTAAEEPWMTYTEADGLSNNSVTSVAIDVDESKWFGTLAGPCHFDGEVWTSYKSPTIGLVSSIAIGPDGVKWFCGRNGLIRFDGESWTNYTTADGLISGEVSSIAVDDDGVAWIGTALGISRFDGETWASYTEADGLADDYVYSIAIDSNGAKWIGTANGVSRFDGDAWVTYTEVDGLASPFVYSVAIDNKGVKWFGTGGGITRFDGDMWNTYLAGAIYYLTVYSLAIDSNGVVWFAADQGLIRLDGETAWTYREANGLASDFVRAVAIDEDDVKWIGTWDGVSRFVGDQPPSVEVMTEDTPSPFSVQPPYPNPFNPRTTISYTLAEPGRVTLAVYNISGQKVATMVDQYMSAGTHTAVFKGSDIASGLYFYRFEASGAAANGKMLLVK